MLPGRSSRITSVASEATEVRSAAPSGVMSSLRSMPHSLASRLGPSRPLSLTRARPWVWSTQVTDSPGACAATASGSSARARPGAASSSHSPGPEPTTSVPAVSLPAQPARAARPNRAPSAAAAWPPTGARSWTLVSGVQSVSVSSASARRPLTSHPSAVTTGGAGAIGLRAIAVFSDTHPPSGDIGPSSDTHPPPVRVDVRMLRLDLRLDAAAARQPHGDHGARLGQPRLDLRQADRAAQRRRHPAGGDPPGDHGPVHDQAGLLRHYRSVDRLQPDQPGPAGALPGELGLADEVVLVQLDRPVQPGAEAPGQAVGVLADDEVALLQPQDPLGLDAERGRAQVPAVLQQRLPDVQPVAGRDVQLVAHLAGEADPPQHAVGDPG